MSERPYFPFYVNDWLSSMTIKLMDNSEQGIYIRMLCYCWEENGLPDSDEELSIISGLRENWNESRIKQCFGEIIEGKRWNRRLYTEKLKLDEYYLQKSQAGKRGMESRYGKPNDDTTPKQRRYNGRGNGSLTTQKSLSEKEKDFVLVEGKRIRLEPGEYIGADGKLARLYPPDRGL